MVNDLNKRSASIRSWALATTLLGGVAMAMPAVAQDEVETISEVDEVDVQEKVVITGSRIARSTFNTTQPLAVVTGADLELRGFTNAADAVYDIPGVVSVGAVQTADFQGGIGIGQNLASLYGLGSQRTLTLVDGKRFVSSNAPNGAAGNTGSQVDLNNIPIGLIDRIEVIKVGGAAVYGADGVAGVINYVLKDDYEGFELATDYTSVGDSGYADETSIRALIGGNFDNGRGNLTASLEWSETSAIVEADVDSLTGDNDFSFFTPANPAPDAPVNQVQAISDPVAGILSFGGLATPGNIAVTNVGVGAFQSGAFWQFDPTGNLVPYDPGIPTGNNVWASGGDGLRLAPLETVREPVERWNFSTFARYDFNEYLQFKGSIFANNFSGRYDFQQPYYSSGLFGGTADALQFDIDYPFLTDQARGVLEQEGVDTFYLQKGFVEFGQQELNETSVFSVNLSLNGDFEAFGRSFNWETFYQNGESKITEISDDRSDERFFAAMDVGVNPETGQIDCRFNYEADYEAPLASGFGVTDDRGVLGSPGDCVPFNPFIETNSPEAQDYVTVSRMNYAQLTQEIFGAYIGGEIYDLPAGGLGVALGVESRRETGLFEAGAGDELDITADGGAVPISGGYQTIDIYGELQIPVISDDMNIPFVDGLDFEGSYRQMDNDRAGKDEAYAVGVNWDIIGGLRFKGNSQRTVRAPGIGELFSPRGPFGDFVTDPCDQRNLDGGPNPEVRQRNCAAGAASAGLPPLPSDFTSNAQNASVQGISGGNPNLKNETSDSYSLGIVYEPHFIDGFSVAVDYINFDIEDAIIRYEPTDLLEGCYDASDFPNALCTTFVRLPNGQLPSTGAFESGFVNAAARLYDAVEITARYQTDVADIPFMGEFEGDLGTIDIDMRVLNVQTDTDKPFASVDNDNVGDEDNPYWRGDVRARYFRGPLTAFVDIEYFGSGRIDVESSTPNQYLTSSGEVVQNVDDAWVFDLGGQYDLTDYLTVRASIENVGDWSPNEVQSATAYGPLEWYLGRTYNVGLTFRF
ncbi:MAG: TonB-dependent receptor [Henriciella sp.]|nr:TonB-dependent receptor [Henriciella sp.]